MKHNTRAKEVNLIASKAQTNSATTTANLDTISADYATIRINFKAELNTNAVGPTIGLLESDDTVVTNFATIVANRTNEDLAAARNLIYHVDCRARKRYLRLSVTSATATNDDITFSAGASLSGLEESPSGTAGMVSSTNDAVVVV